MSFYKILTEKIPQVEERKEEVVRHNSEPTPMGDIGLVLNSSKSLMEEEKGLLTPSSKTLSYTTMGHLLTTFKDGAQLKKLEDMIEFIKLEVEAIKEKINKVNQENITYKKRFKELLQ